MCGLLAFFLAASVTCLADPAGLKPVVGQAHAFIETGDVKNLPGMPLAAPEGEDSFRRMPIRYFRRSPKARGPLTQRDPVIQSSSPGQNIPSPGLTFEGINNNCACLPPDTNGDVGPNHYVQTVNSHFRVYNKSTGTALTSILPINSLFAGLGNPCDTTNDGDPVVLYDPLADRWLIAQFANAFAGPPFYMSIAISKTPDPTGAWYAYCFAMPNTKLNDYPKLGVWPDGYYMTDNQFNGNSWAGGGVFAFDRAKMLAGDPTASYIYFDLYSVDSNIGGMLPSDLDGPPPPVGTPNYFAYFTATEYGEPQDGLRVFQFKANWTNTAASTFTERPESPLTVASFNPNVAAIPQPGTPQALDTLDDRLMFRLQYRYFGSNESLVVNHTVVGGAGQAGVRYYQLKRNLTGASTNWFVNEQATFAPDSTNRWMGSAAMDYYGNLAVGYSASSSSLYPSIYYAGRLASDLPNGLYQGENVLYAGTGSQTSTSDRWGDYSSMSVDPTDDTTFWYTTEYYQGTSSASWRTRIGKFSLTNALAPRATITGWVTDSATGLPVTNALVRTTTGYVRIPDATGRYTMGVYPGTYNMVASAPSYGAVTNLGVLVAASTIVTQNFVFAPLPPNIVANGATLSAENCGTTNGVVDPGETVTLNFTLQNIGSLPTTNLTATLLATGGVNGPSAPQNYGAIAGGTAATRPFSFTASGTCGGDVVAVLSLVDGPTSYGLITNLFTMGLPGASITNNYSSGGLATAISDNSTVEVPITISTTGIVTDVNVKIRLNHTYDADLVISLVHPDGTVVTLANKRGGSSNNFGSGTADCNGTFTVFDDAAATPIGSGSAPFAGSYQPESPLAGLNGKATEGVWKLRVADTATVDTGTIYCFQLDLARLGNYSCCNAAAAPDLSITKTPSPEPVYINSNLTYTVAITNLGDAAAASVTVTDTLPASVTFVSASPACAFAAGNVICNLGTLTSGAQSNVTITVATTALGSLINTAVVTTATTELFTADNTAVAASTVVDLPPNITAAPAPQNVCSNATAHFTVAATGNNLAYQWQKNSVNLSNTGHYSGVTTTNLTVSFADSSDAANYRCLVSNSGGTATSAVAALTIKTATAITGQPAPAGVCLGSTAQFSITAIGAGALTYQWQKNTVNLSNGGHYSGVTSNVLTISNADGGDVADYRCVVTADCGSATSSAAALTLSGPILAASPASHAFGLLATGTTAQTTFVVTNTGCAALTGTASTTAPFAVLSGTSYTVAAGGSSNVVVSFAPTAATNYAGAVIFTSTGGNSTNQLTGTGFLPLPEITGAGGTLVGEGCAPTNGVVDPGEIVTMSFALQNVGSADTANLVATLVATNGVTNPSAPQNYGALTAGGGAVSRTFTFTADAVCGGTIRPMLQLQDGANNLGIVTNVFSLGVLSTLNFSNANTSAVTIPASGNRGQAAPYPSSITMSSVSGTVSKVTVVLKNLSHTRADNLDILLVGPGGQSALLMSDAGGNNSLSGVTLTFDMTGAPLPTTAISSGTYAPTDYNSGDSFDSPAPGGPYGTDLGVFNGVDPNGVWSLYIMDDASPNTGNLAGGWQLNVATTVTRCCASAPTADLAIFKADAPDPVTVGSNLTYSITVTNLGVVAATSVVVTDALQASVNFVSASAGCVTNTGNVICNLGTITSGSRTNVSIIVIPTAAGGLANSATVGSAVLDPDPDNNLATAFTTVHDVPPAITVNPSAQNVCSNGVANFVVATTGLNLAFQWQKDSADLTDTGHYSGTTTSNLVVSSATTNDVANYRCLISNSGGAVTSAVAALTIKAATVTGKPDPVSVCLGGIAQFSVSATGAGTLTYQWQKNSVNLGNGGHYSGVTSNVLTVSNADATDEADYRCVVTGDCGPNASSAAALTLLMPQLDVNPVSRDFGILATGTTAQTNLTVSNTGACLLTGTASTTAPFAVVGASAYGVAAGGSTNILVSFTPTVASNYNGSVSLTSNGGNIGVPVTGRGAIVPVASFGASPTNGVAPLLVTFTDTSAGTITNRFWSFGDGSITNLTTNVVAHTYAAAGTNNVTLIVSGPVGISTNTKAAYIVALTPPQLGVSPGSYDFGVIATGTMAQTSFIVTNSGQAVLTGSANAPAPFAVTAGTPFSVSGGSATNVTVIFTPTAPVASVTNLIFSTNGGNSTNPLTGTGAIIPTANFTGSPTNGIAPLFVTFTDTSAGTITNRFWSFGDGSITNLTTNVVAHTYAAAGTNNVTLIVSGPVGVSTNTKPAYIVALTPPQLGVSPGSYDFGILATGTTAQTSFIVTNVGQAVLTGTAGVPAPFAVITGTPFSVSGGSATNVTVTFTPTAPVASTTNLIFITNAGISTNPLTGTGAIVPVALFAASPTNGLAPLLVTFTDTSTGTITNRFWDFGGGATSNTTALVVTHTYNLPSTNTVQLIVTGPLGTSTNTAVNLIVARPVDSVGDGIPDAWRQLYFGGDGSTTNAQSCALCDPDGDGFWNKQEYLAGTHPLDWYSALRILSLEPTNNDVLVIWLTVGGHTNVVEWMPSLLGPTNSSPLFIMPGSSLTPTNFLHTGGATNSPSLYYRIRLVP